MVTERGCRRFYCHFFACLFVFLCSGYSISLSVSLVSSPLPLFLHLWSTDSPVTGVFGLLRGPTLDSQPSLLSTSRSVHSILVPPESWSPQSPDSCVYVKSGLSPFSSGTFDRPCLSIDRELSEDGLFLSKCLVCSLFR